MSQTWKIFVFMLLQTMGWNTDVLAGKLMYNNHMKHTFVLEQEKNNSKIQRAELEVQQESIFVQIFLNKSVCKIGVCKQMENT